MIGKHRRGGEGRGEGRWKVEHHIPLCGYSKSIVIHNQITTSHWMHITWKVLTENFNGSGALRVPYLLISLLQCVCFQALPWQTASQEVHEHVPQCFQVISPTLFCTWRKWNSTVTWMAQHVALYDRKKVPTPPATSVPLESHTPSKAHFQGVNHQTMHYL